jgi:hypothetical protein
MAEATDRLSRTDPQRPSEQRQGDHGSSNETRGGYADGGHIDAIAGGDRTVARANSAVRQGVDLSVAGVHSVDLVADAPSEDDYGLDRVSGVGTGSNRVW